MASTKNLDSDWSNDSSEELDLIEEEVRLYSLVHHSSSTFEPVPIAVTTTDANSDSIRLSNSVTYLHEPDVTSTDVPMVIPTENQLDVPEFHHCLRTKVNRLDNVKGIIDTSNRKQRGYGSPEITRGKNHGSSDIGKQSHIEILSNMNQRNGRANQNNKNNKNNQNHGNNRKRGDVVDNVDCGKQITKSPSLYFNNLRTELANVRPHDDKVYFPRNDVNTGAPLQQVCSNKVTEVQPELVRPKQSGSLQNTDSVEFSFDLSSHGVISPKVPSKPGAGLGNLFSPFNDNYIRSRFSHDGVFRLDERLFVGSPEKANVDIRQLEENLFTNLASSRDDHIRSLEECLFQSAGITSPMTVENDNFPICRPKAKDRLGPIANTAPAMTYLDDELARGRLTVKDRLGPLPTGPNKLVIGRPKAKDRLGPKTNAAPASTSLHEESPRGRPKVKSRLGPIVNEVLPTDDIPKHTPKAKGRSSPLMNINAPTDVPLDSLRSRPKAKDRSSPLMNVGLNVPTDVPTTLDSLRSKPKAKDRLSPLMNVNPLTDTPMTLDSLRFRPKAKNHLGQRADVSFTPDAPADMDLASCSSETRNCSSPLTVTDLLEEQEFQSQLKDCLDSWTTLPADEELQRVKPSSKNRMRPVIKNQEIIDLIKKSSGEPTKEKRNLGKVIEVDLSDDVQNSQDSVDDIVVLDEYVNLKKKTVISKVKEVIILDSDNDEAASSSDESVVVVVPPARPEPIVIAVEDSSEEDPPPRAQHNAFPTSREPVEDIVESSFDFLDNSYDMDGLARTQAKLLSNLISSHGSKESLIDEQFFQAVVPAPAVPAPAYIPIEMPNQDDNVTSSTFSSGRTKSPDLEKIRQYIESYSKRPKVPKVHRNIGKDGRNTGLGTESSADEQQEPHGFSIPESPRKILRKRELTGEVEPVDDACEDLVAVHSGTKMDVCLEDLIIASSDKDEVEGLVFPRVLKKKKRSMDQARTDAAARKTPSKRRRLPTVTDYGIVYTEVFGNEPVADSPPRNPTKWTKHMRKFYNKSWGGENFSYEALQRNMSTGTKLWGSFRDLRLSTKSNQKRCNNCHMMGHVSFHCPKPERLTCHMCGKLGHTHTNCPNSVCLQCGQPNRRYVNNCLMCVNSKYDNCLKCIWRHHPTQPCKPPGGKRGSSSYRSVSASKNYSNKGYNPYPRNRHNHSR